MTIESVSRASRAALLSAKEQGVTEPIDTIIIGRDVLELVSSAMYVDPMSVYREYIQNAADAVDEARDQGVLGPADTGMVSIDIDPTSRSVRIRDNGTGVANDVFATKMTALGASGKRGTSARGFRGIGRLAGLGYAQELIFRSKAKGDAFVGELIWDCRKLKSSLKHGGGDIESLVRSVAIYRKKPVGDYPDHFFEVELRGIVRIRSDKLMSPAAVEDYLSQVAPVPFAGDFRFGEEIRAALAPLLRLGELDIRVNGSASAIRRPHRDIMQLDSGKAISFNEVTVSMISGIEGDLAAVAWVLHHDYEGALPNAAGVKGLRFRSGNIQVGDHNLLEDLFPEPRFNAWAVGEIHVVDSKITPNGRRDHFEQNSHYTNLTNQIAPATRDIARRCRTSSIRRNCLREVDLHTQQVEQSLEVIAQGVLDEAARHKHYAGVEESFERLARNLRNPVIEPDDIKERAVLVDGLRKRFEDAKVTAPSAPELHQLDEHEQRAFEKICGLIYECAPSASFAKSLIDKMILKLQ